MSKQKYGFVYIWLDKKHKRYYVGCHWGFEDDGYICSSSWMNQAYRIRPSDFKRRILKSNISSRIELYKEEQRWLNMIKENEIKPLNKNPRYYNLNIKNNEIWHKYEHKIKIIGEKISIAKKGKRLGPRPEVGSTISAAKKGKKLTDEHKKALTGIKKRPHTEEWKLENSKRMKEQWKINTKRKEATSKALKKRWEEYRTNKLKLTQ